MLYQIRSLMTVDHLSNQELLRLLLEGDCAFLGLGLVKTGKESTLTEAALAWQGCLDPPGWKPIGQGYEEQD